MLQINEQDFFMAVWDFYIFLTSMYIHTSGIEFPYIG